MLHSVEVGETYGKPKRYMLMPECYTGPGPDTGTCAECEEAGMAYPADGFHCKADADACAALWNELVAATEPASPGGEEAGG